MGNIKEKVLSEYKKGNIVICQDGCGLRTMPLSEFLKQPVEGVLYDLNRSEAVILQNINDPKWVNDLAACKVIRALAELVEKLQAENAKLREVLEIVRQYAVVEYGESASCRMIESKIQQVFTQSIIYNPA